MTQAFARRPDLPGGNPARPSARLRSALAEAPTPTAPLQPVDRPAQPPIPTPGLVTPAAPRDVQLSP